MIAFRGLSTNFNRRLLRTCPIPSGEVTSVVVAVVKLIWIGKRKLMKTATRAAAKVPSKYKRITVLIFVVFPFLCWEIALATRKNTKIGAIALSPPTKSSPRSPIPGKFGKSKPSRVPRSIPIRIRLIRLDLFQALIILLIHFSFFE